MKKILFTLFLAITISFLSCSNQSSNPVEKEPISENNGLDSQNDTIDLETTILIDTDETIDSGETEGDSLPQTDDAGSSHETEPETSVEDTVTETIIDTTTETTTDTIIDTVVDTIEDTQEDTTTNSGLTIYYIRHAETIANVTGDQSGGSMEGHNEFSELGHEQIDNLKNYLIENSIEPDEILVSPAWRSQKTIEPYLIETENNAKIWVELNECCGGDPTTSEIPTEPSISRLRAEIEAENTEFRNSEDHFFWFPQTYEEGLFMVMTAVDSLLSRYSQTGKTIFVIGHAGHGNMFAGVIRGYNMLNEFPETQVYLRNTGIQHFHQNPETGNIELVNQNINFPRWWE